MSKLVPLNEIFSIKYGSQFDLNKLEKTKDTNGINFISRTSKNCGVICKVLKFNNILPFNSGCITISLGGEYLLSAFLQQEPFYTAQNVKVLTAIDENMPIEVKLFYCYIITKNRFRYTSHGREANKTIDHILVPHPKCIPSYVNNVIEKIKIPSRKSCNQKKIELDPKNWLSFEISNLFTKIEKAKCNNASLLLNDGDDIFYIGAKKKDNGVINRVKFVKELSSTGNAIVFIGDGQGSVGYALYQPIDFIGSTTLTIGYNKNLNKYNAMFIVTILDLERYRYSFGKKYGKNIISKTRIKLPATSQGTPA
ncbi:restriction endonuclease subunit S, partial [Rickettsia asembonensis]